MNIEHVARACYARFQDGHEEGDTLLDWDDISPSNQELWMDIAEVARDHILDNVDGIG